jgi:hypothetical protein
VIPSFVDGTPELISDLDFNGVGWSMKGLHDFPHNSVTLEQSDVSHMQK